MQNEQTEKKLQLIFFFFFLKVNILLSERQIDCESEKDSLPNPHVNIVLHSLMPSSKMTTIEVRVGSSQLQLMAASGLDFSFVHCK